MITFMERDDDGVLSLVTSPLYAGFGMEAVQAMEACDHEFVPSPAHPAEPNPGKPSCMMQFEVCRCGATRCRCTGPEDELLEGMTEVPP